MKNSPYKIALDDYSKSRAEKAEELGRLSAKRIELNNQLEEARKRESLFSRDDCQRDIYAKEVESLRIQAESITRSIFDLRTEISEIDESSKKLEKIKAAMDDKPSPMEFYRNKYSK